MSNPMIPPQSRPAAANGVMLAASGDPPAGRVVTYQQVTDRAGRATFPLADRAAIRAWVEAWLDAQALVLAPDREIEIRLRPILTSAEQAEARADAEFEADYR